MTILPCVPNSLLRSTTAIAAGLRVRNQSITYDCLVLSTLRAARSAIQACGLVDTDLRDLGMCLDMAGRSTVTEM